MRLEEIAHFTNDVDRMVRFYEKFLHRKPARWQPGQDAEFSVDGLKLFIHAKADHPVAGYPPDVHHVAFAVDDVDAACERLKSQGLSMDFEPADYPWGRSAYVRDPDGNWFELHQLRTSSARGQGA